MASSFTIVTRASARIGEVFDESLSIDAHVASMEHSRERAVGGVTSGEIGLGESVTWRARHFGIWFEMTSQITELDRPHRFTDVQVRGPFRSFRHDHRFTQSGETAIIEDTLTIESPVLGALAERLVLVPYLRRLIRRRNDYLLGAVRR